MGRARRELKAPLNLPCCCVELFSSRDSSCIHIYVALLHVNSRRGYGPLKYVTFEWSRFCSLGFTRVKIRECVCSPTVDRDRFVLRYPRDQADCLPPYRNDSSLGICLHLPSLSCRILLRFAAMSLNDVVRFVTVIARVIFVLKIIKGMLVLVNGLLDVSRASLHKLNGTRNHRGTEDGSPSDE